MQFSQTQTKFRFIAPFTVTALRVALCLSVASAVFLAPNIVSADIEIQPTDSCSVSATGRVVISQGLGQVWTAATTTMPITTRLPYGNLVHSGSAWLPSALFCQFPNVTEYNQFLSQTTNTGLASSRCVNMNDAVSTVTNGSVATYSATENAVQMKRNWYSVAVWSPVSSGSNTTQSFTLYGVPYDIYNDGFFGYGFTGNNEGTAAKSQCSNLNDLAMTAVGIGDFTEPSLELTNLLSRFTGQSITSQKIGSAARVTFNVGYFLQLTELNTDVVSKNPQMIQVRLAKKPNVTFGATSEFITPWVQGQSTSSIVYPQDLEDGTYEVNINFYNASAAWEGVQVLPYTYILGEFDVISGIVQNPKFDKPYTGGQYSASDTPYEACAAVSGTFVKGACEVITFLFVPSEESIDKAFEFYSGSDVPWINAAYAAYEGANQYINSGGTTDFNSYTLDYDFGAQYAVPGLNIQMFAISDIITYIAPYGGIPRAIILTSVIIMFLYMAFNSINNLLTVFYSDSIGTRRLK